MAQHDYSIANQGFPAFRSDLNDALAAIVSNNSGATEPTTMFAHQMWVDTAADPSVLKIRNADNDAWITIGTIDQTGDTFTLTSAVSATTLNTSDVVVFSVDSSSDALRITQVGTGNALVVEDSANPDSTPFVIDASGRVINGSTISISADDAGGGNRTTWAYQANNTTVSGAGYLATYWADLSTGPGGLSMGKSRGAAVGTRAIVQDDDELGQIGFLGDDGTNFISAAGIFANVDGTPGTDDMPGRLSFRTTADGASLPTEKMRITSNGYVRLASGSLGIQFNGDTASANALNDYEEGTFTPTIYGLTTAGTPTYTVQLGKYTKIGNVVIFNLLITLSNKGGMAGSLRIGDLPFTDISDSINAAVSIGNMSGMSITAGETVMGRVVNNSSYISLFLTDAVSGNTNLQDTEIGDTFSIDVAGSYFVS